MEQVCTFCMHEQVSIRLKWLRRTLLLEKLNISDLYCVCVCVGGGDYIYRLHHIAAEIDADHGFLM